ncbi:MAG TPA: TlyA family RNA methyltransferase [Rhodocyclaceae bacterium]|nr:TlyA family RNA methyltransferase [Rhodocyclaceae bacterium]
MPGHHAAPTRQRSGVRLDQLLVEQGLAASRTTARRMIEAGRVSYLGETQSKPAQELPADAALQVVADGSERYVSRGGLKLAGALAHSGLDVSGWDCLDVGQSTGGFTDCLLQAGAAQVVGVDVGHDQLHTRLRGNPRVSCLQHINCRTLTREDLGIAMPRSKFDLIVADLSFISLTLVLPQLPPLLKLAGEMLLLVKPQFEVGPQGIGKGGLVRDPALYVEVEAKLRQCAADLHLRVLDWFDSPITGGDGNREFFLRLEHENRTLD